MNSPKRHKSIKRNGFTIPENYQEKNKLLLKSLNELDKGSTGTIYNLSYDYDSETGFLSKIITRAEKSSIYDSINQTYKDPYEIVNSDCFSDDYINTINKAFSLTEYLFSGSFLVTSYSFFIDILDPPDVSPFATSGDSAGLAMFLSAISALYNMPIVDGVAVTGNLYGNISCEIGLVDNIIGKIRNQITEKGSIIKRLIIPDLWYLRNLTVNKKEVDDLISELSILIENRNDDISIFFCKSVIDTFKYVFTRDGWNKLIVNSILFSSKIRGDNGLFESLCMEYLHNKHNVFCRNKYLADMTEFRIMKNMSEQVVALPHDCQKILSKLCWEKKDQIIELMRFEDKAIG